MEGQWQAGEPAASRRASSNRQSQQHVCRRRQKAQLGKKSVQADSCRIAACERYTGRQPEAEGGVLRGPSWPFVALRRRYRR